jgi:hypothetical protein
MYALGPAHARAGVRSPARARPVSAYPEARAADNCRGAPSRSASPCPTATTSIVCSSVARAATRHLPPDAGSRSLPGRKVACARNWETRATCPGKKARVSARPCLRARRWRSSRKRSRGVSAACGWQSRAANAAKIRWPCVAAVVRRPMRVPVSWIEWALVAASLSACRGATEPTPLEAVWPPVEGEYCGDARGMCDAEGVPWRCGPRPFWQRLDCAAICQAQAGAPHGCVMREWQDQRAAAQRLVPDGLANTLDVNSGIEDVACVCRPPDELACAGPSHRLCAGRAAVWACSASMTWELQPCDAKCAAQKPPMVVDECEHDVDTPHVDGCRCTLVGAPCADEGQWQCADRRHWLRCEQGAWTRQISCRDEFECENPTVGLCDVNPGAEGGCVCIDLY